MDGGTMLAPVAREESLTEKVYRSLRGALTGGRLVPGQRLVHRALAAELGVSPTPVREALLRLVSEAALELDARGIAWVPRLVPERYQEIVELRVELEGRAAARATQLATPADLAALRALHAGVAEGRRTRNPALVLRENERFHFALLELARMPVLTRLVESLWLQAGPTINLLFRPGAPAVQGAHPHEDLLAAMAAGDAPAARRAMERDLREHAALITQALQSAAPQTSGK